MKKPRLSVYHFCNSILLDPISVCIAFQSSPTYCENADIITIMVKLAKHYCIFENENHSGWYAHLLGCKLPSCLPHFEMPLKRISG